MAGKKITVSPDVKNFPNAVAALFEEARKKNWTGSDDFKFIRSQLIDFFDLCNSEGVSKAKAKLDIRLSNGLPADTSIGRPPGWMKIVHNDKSQLSKTIKPKSFVNVLSQILHRQAKAQLQAQEQQKNQTLDTSFGNPTPSPETKPRKRRSAKLDSDEDDYEPLPPKKAKVGKAAPNIARTAPVKRKVVLKRSAPAHDEIIEKKPKHKSQKTLDWKVTKKTNPVKEKSFKQPVLKEGGEPAPLTDARKLPEQSTSSEPASKPARPDKLIVLTPEIAPEAVISVDSQSSPSTISESQMPKINKINFAKLFEDVEVNKTLDQNHAASKPLQNSEQDNSKALQADLFDLESSYQPIGPIPREGMPAGKASSVVSSRRTLEQQQENQYIPNELSQSVEQSRTPVRLVAKAQSPSPESVGSSSRRCSNTEDSDIDTEVETNDDSSQDNALSSPVTRRSNVEETADFWTSAPKTLKPRALTLLQHPECRVRERADTPLQRLRASLGIYKSRISHIPPQLWRKYNKKLEKFVQSPQFSDMSFLQRFGRIRHIVYINEEDEAELTGDWERIRMAASLCGFLAEITAPEGTDDKDLVERMVSTNIKDLNWLERTVGTKADPNAPEVGDAMEGIETDATA